MVQGMQRAQTPGRKCEKWVARAPEIRCPTKEERGILAFTGMYSRTLQHLRADVLTVFPKTCCCAWQRLELIDESMCPVRSACP